MPPRPVSVARQVNFGITVKLETAGNRAQHSDCCRSESGVTESFESVPGPGLTQASSLFRLSHGPCHSKQPECRCTDKTDLESSLAWTFLPLARPHCDLAGLFNGNFLFIELSLELCYPSWYIGAVIGVAACHDADQGSSLNAVNNKKIIVLVS
jgi:hypothetical protein